MCNLQKQGAFKCAMDTSSDQNNVDKKPVCKYGANCYRKNSDHLKNYKHPTKRQLQDLVSPDQKRARHQDSTSEEEAMPLDAGEARPSPSNVEDSTAASVSHSMSPVPPDAGDADLSGGDQIEDAEVDEEQQSNLLPESPASDKENIKQKFLVDMPKDFYSFLKFCQSLDSNAPQDALSSCGLQLAGPFLLLLGHIKPMRRAQEFYLTFCRYYYDPPEVQTVLCGEDVTSYHIGYFRDDPSELPVQVVANSAEKDANFAVLGDNLFSAVNKLVTSQLTSADGSRREALTRLQQELRTWAARCSFPLDARTPAMKQRDKLVLGRTLQGLGVVVPYDKKHDVGYRTIPETPASLRKILRRIVEAESEEERNAARDKLQEVIQDVQFANDEGDPGMGLELGLDVFSFGGEVLHSTVKHLLLVAYELLNRPVSAQILQAHLANRRKGPVMI